MMMEYTVLRATHPTYLNLQLPTEVADLIHYYPAELKNLRSPARGLAFLARTPGVVRVIPAYRGSEQVSRETREDRYVATALLSEKLVFSLPEAVTRYLGLEIQQRHGHENSGPRFTDDSILWFLPKTEYVHFRVQQRKREVEQSTMAHVYLTKSHLPSIPGLEELEAKVETGRSVVLDERLRVPSPLSKSR